MRISKKRLIEVGIFITVAFAVVFFAVFSIGEQNKLFSRSYTLIAPFDDISGMRAGAVVQLSGLRIGYVDGVHLPEKNEEMIEVILNISTEYQEYIREDSIASIQTQGLLGDKYIFISRGNSDSPVLKENSVLQTRVSQGVADFAKQGSEMIEEVKRAAEQIANLLEDASLQKENKGAMKNIVKNMEEASGNLNGIFKEINEGRGTIGALVKDPSLYNDLRAVMGRANRSKLLKGYIRTSIEEQEKASQK
ncbi:MAG: MlaD family protein [Deltaproteobacteria bacterium]|nr:MlaD family protein [Deltaproteobacteria bacterium]